MDLTPLAQVLATTEQRPARASRVLYLTGQDDGLAPAGYADAVGDVATVLDRLDTEGADGLAVQVRVPHADGDRPAAVVVDRGGHFALAVVDDGDDPVLTRDTPPRRDDPVAVAACWRVIVHALAAVDRSDAVPEPPDDPHPAAYLAGAWLVSRLASRGDNGHALDRVELPSESGLVEDLDLPAELTGWDAVHAAVQASSPEQADRLGRNGVAWEAHELLGDPGRALASVAESVGTATADRFFEALVERGWARPA